jgi:hypothetical protein
MRRTHNWLCATGRNPVLWQWEFESLPAYAKMQWSFAPWGGCSYRSIPFCVLGLAVGRPRNSGLPYGVTCTKVASLLCTETGVEFDSH